MRFFADIYDADGKAYVFDEAQGGIEVAGPFDSIDAAISDAEERNANDG